MKTYIREVRKQAGISQQELAEKIGVTQGAIAFWESGKRIPSLLALYRIGVVLHKAPASLVDQEMMETIRKNHRLQAMVTPSEDSPEWDYLIEMTKANEKEREEGQQNEKIRMVVEMMPKLNDKGISRLLEYATDLCQLPSYSRTDPEGKESNGDS